MPDHEKIYFEQADRYEHLVGREDYQHNLLPALQDIVDFSGKDIIELGAGTGRLTRLLAPLAATIHAFDHSPAMLRVAQTKVPSITRWQPAVADHRHIPLPPRSADIIVSGWSFCYLVMSNQETWEQELSKGVAEIERLLRPDGTFIILETLGTGHETPFVYESLADYYTYLERVGFQRTWIRTDFRFETLEEAESAIDFFFGEPLAQKVVDHHWATLPECTGIWWKSIHPTR